VLQEVAKEALGEAEKSLKTLQQVMVVYAMTKELLAPDPCLTGKLCQA
jgi:hypothetical protein